MKLSMGSDLQETKRKQGKFTSQCRVLTTTSSLGFCVRNQKKGCFSIMVKHTLKPHKIIISRFNHGK